MATPVKPGRSALLREPLVHFALIGALIFAADRWWLPGGDAGRETRIVVDAARLKALEGNFQRTWRRPPDERERRELIDEYVREEVLNREAGYLGLDRDDTVVRRRLRQKMEFLAEEALSQERPAEATLRQFYGKVADEFRRPAAYTFSQVVLDPGRHGGALAAHARRLQERLAAAGPAGDLGALSESRLLETHVEAMPRDQVESRFGAEFAAALASLPVNQWSGPIPSGYGVHLVRVEAVAPGALPDWKSARGELEGRWRQEQRRHALDEQYRQIRERYQVEVRHGA